MSGIVCAEAVDIDDRYIIDDLEYDRTVEYAYM
jgi:hypothetical protein